MANTTLSRDFAINGEEEQAVGLEDLGSSTATSLRPEVVNDTVSKW